MCIRDSIQAPKDGPAIELYGGASACLYFIGNDSELIGAENFAALQKNKTDGYLRVLVQTGTKLTCEGGRYGAVSYTHLDVYKRQILRSLRLCLLHSLWKDFYRSLSSVTMQRFVS